MKLKFLDQHLELGGSYLSSDLTECNDIIDDGEALRQKMDKHGYLLVRGIHDRSLVLSARESILTALSARGMLKSGVPITDAKFNPEFNQGASTSAVSNEQLAHIDQLDAIVNGSKISSFFESIFGAAVTSFDYRWLRTAGHGAASPIHCDNVFMGRGSQQFYTCWSPLCDVDFKMGPLVLCLGSHKMDAITQTYGSSDVDRDLIAGHFSDDPLEMIDYFGCQWATTEFRAGDAIIFDRHILHASLTNESDSVRLSLDTRYQPAADPIDERWIGKTPKGHYAWKAPEAVHEPLAVSRARWCV